MKERDVWGVIEDAQPGSYMSLTESPLTGLHYMSIRRLDALILTNDVEKASVSDNEDAFSDCSEVSFNDDLTNKKFLNVSIDKNLRRHCQSSLDLSPDATKSLQFLHDICEQRNGRPTQKYRRHYSATDGDAISSARHTSIVRNKSSGNGSGYTKLKRQNACRPILRKDESGTGTNYRPDNVSIDNSSGNNFLSTDNQQYEWRKIVGSIRRRVSKNVTTNQPETSEQVQTCQIRRKSSLTTSKLDFLRREKSKEENLSDRKDNMTLSKQKSVGFEFDSQNKNRPKILTENVNKNSSCKNISDNFSKGVLKSDLSNMKSTSNKDSNLKVQKPNFTLSKKFCSKSSENKKLQQEKNREDFLKATMRIFLVVSPPVGKMQVRSRSLNHLDTLEASAVRHQQPDTLSICGSGAVFTDEVAVGVGGPGASGPLHDSVSEPDCSMHTHAQQTQRHAQTPDRLLHVPSQNERDQNHGGSSQDRHKLGTTGRRQMLSRSQVSSSEYFSVSFELGDDAALIHGKEEFLPATKGTTLSEALAKVCERRSIDLSICDIYIDGCRSTPYILHQETSILGGKTLRITPKESGNRKTSSSNNLKKSTGSYRGRSGLFFSTSTEDASVLSGSISTLLQEEKKQSKQRWSGFFSNNKDTKMESLADQLNYYSQHESFKTLISECQDEVVNALYNLEEDWREILDTTELTERQQQQQTAIWELISTEVAYIKTLRVVTGLFLACLESLQCSNILIEIDKEKLFSNITEILECNLAFWGSYLYPAVQRMRISRKPTSPLMFHDGFVRMADIYHPYYRYCAEQARCQHYCKEIHAHNEVFTAYLVWCETQKECNRLRLMDILVRPMQRLTKYGLLLKAIYKNTDDEYEKDCLCTMIKSVDEFVNNVNSSLRQKQDNERLRGIIARIESYDAVETKDDDLQQLVQKHTQFDLSQPMPGCPPERRRHLLLEGDLKLKDTTSSKIEVHCFLLTDVLLVCKPSSKKGSAMMRVIRQPYLVDRLVITELNRETPSLAVVYLNEFKTANAAFILQNNDQKKLKAWADCIRKAQGLYEQAKHTPSLGLTRQLSSSVPGDDYIDTDYSLDYSMEGESHLQSLIPRSPLASSSRASRVSSLAHSHSGSVEMNDQSSIGSINNHSRGISIENENRTASISSDEGIQPIPTDHQKSPINQKNSLKNRLFLTSPKTLTPNTLSVQPYANLGQSLPNLTLGSPNVGTVNITTTHHNTLLVPNAKNGNQLLSPNQRGISYPPPSPTRGNLRRGFAISQKQNPPLMKTGHVNSSIGAAVSLQEQEPTSFDFDVPVIAGVSPPDDSLYDSFSRGQHRQAMTKRGRGDTRRYHTAGVVDDIKKFDEKDGKDILKRLSWNCGPTSGNKQQPTSTSSSTSTSNLTSGASGMTASSTSHQTNEDHQNTKSTTITTTTTTTNT